jgi:capsule polysaccharide export protein KpsE/RkpR
MGKLKEEYLESRAGQTIDELEIEFEEIMHTKHELSNKYGYEVGFWEARTHYFLDKIEAQIDEAKRALHLNIYSRGR